jgi:hypothetical protein
MLDDFDDFIVDEVDDDKENSDESDLELDASVQQSDDRAVQDVIDSLEGDVEDEGSSTRQLSHLTCEELDLGCCTLTKLINLRKRVFNSPTLCEDLKTCYERSKIKSALMLRSVAMRWNMISELIGCALLLRDALNLLVGLEQHNKGRHGMRLIRFKLSKQEWEVLEQLHPLLDISRSF